MGDRWLYNGVVFFLLLPFSIYTTYVTKSPIAVGFGAALTVWRIAVTPEIRNHLTLNFIFKGKKQVVKDSPGASLKQAENIYEFNIGKTRQETAQLPDNLVKAYTSMRKTVKGWLDPRWSGFYDWSSLDEEDPRSVIQIRKSAPELAELCDRSVSLFGEINTLRTEVSTLIEEEQEKLVQEYQPKFDSPKVKFAFFRISADGGNDDTLYLLHAWMKGQNVREHGEFRARERVGKLKTWRLELLVTGQRLGNPLTQRLDTLTQPVAMDDEAINLGQRVLDYLDTQEPARSLRDKLKKVQVLRGEILPLIEKELSKG